MTRNHQAKKLILGCSYLAANLLASSTWAATTGGSFTASFQVSASVSTLCTVTATPIVFGTYGLATSGGGASSNSALYANGTVSVGCTASSGQGSSSSYAVQLSSGSSGSYNPRTMLTNGSNALNYNIYTTANYQTVWGDGTGATSTVAGTANGINAPTVYTTYGQIPAGQYLPAAGTYTDTIIATVVY